MNDKGLEIWKRRFAELEEKVRRLNNDRNILVNLLNEIKAKQGIKLNILLKDKELEEEISYLNGWIEFHKEKIAKYEKKIRIAGKEASLKEFDKIREEAKLGELLENKKEKPVILKLTKPLKKGRVKEKIIKLAKVIKSLPNIKEKFAKASKKPLIKYAVPFIILLLIFTGLFFLKPAITGYVTLTQEKTYDDNLNLIINESGNYTWVPDKFGFIKSIKASGKVMGNGTIKAYIEKDGKRYLIFEQQKK